MVAQTQNARFNPRYVPVETVPPTQHRQKKAARDRAECPRCEKAVVGAAIVTDAPVSIAPRTWFVERRFYCDHCRHIVHWHQVSNEAGDQLGDILPVDGVKFDIIRGKAVEAFLRDHPAAAGVAQVAQ